MNIKQIIREEMDGLDWIRNEELPILPYIGKRFKLIRDDGQDSGRRYQILDYYFEDEYNKDFYIKSILLNPRTLKPRTKTTTKHEDIFHTPLSRAMELINNGNWVFLDTINESQDDFDWIRETNPMDEIARVLLNNINIRGHHSDIYFRPWSYNIPYHVIKPDRLRSFDDSYNRIKDEFFRYLSMENGPRIYNNRNILELLPLDLIKFVKNGLSDDQKEYIWDKFIDGILKQLDFRVMNESQDDFDWVDDPNIPLRPYPGEEYIWIGWGKNSYTGASKRSIRFGTKLSDVIRIRRVDEPPLTGVYFNSVDDESNKDMTNIETWNRLVRSGKIIPLKGMGINESQDDFDWIKDVTKNITHGTCLKSDKGVEYIVQDINHKLEDVYVKSKRGGARQTWSLRSLNIKLKNGTLELCDINESQDDFDWVRDIDPEDYLLEIKQEFHDWLVRGLVGDDEIFTYYVTAEELIGDYDINMISDVRQRILINKEEPSKVFCEALGELDLEYPSKHIICKDAKRKNKKPSFLKRMFNIKESDDFDWVRDSDPIEVIDLNDQWHVDTIKVDDKLEITGEYDGIEFYNEPCQVICVGTCSEHPYSSSVKWNAWEHQILVSFERGFYSKETDEETHCGPDSRSEKKCNCREVDGVVGHTDEPYMVGTCWWVNIPSLDEVVRINVGDINESEKILESLFNKLSILTEDGKTEPDMEWDFTKDELDKSKRWVKTKEDVKKYLTLLFNKMKRIPKRVKLNILKYVLVSFIGIITFTELQQMVDEVSPEKIELNFTKKEKPEMVKKPEVAKNVNVRKPSSRLYDFLRDEEKLRTTAYDIGDGHVTIGYGHAERGGETDMVAGKTKISKEKAEELLKQDVETQTRYLNRILRQWEEKGIKPEITQGMYDSMISLMFNMGYGNFRKADFVQDIKKGDFKTAKEKIRKTHITYPGHKPRREKESQMFDLP